MNKTVRSVLLSALLVTMLLLATAGGCDEKNDQQNTACIDYNNCINQKKAQNVPDDKAKELCGPNPCGGVWTGAAPKNTTNDGNNTNGT